MAAHSYFNGERFGASRDIEAFLLGKDITESHETISEDEKLREYIMLSLRLTNGLDLRELEKRLGMTLFEFYPKAEMLIGQEYLKIEGGRLSFTDKGFFVSNTILSDMLDFN